MTDESQNLIQRVREKLPPLPKRKTGGLVKDQDEFDELHEWRAGRRVENYCPHCGRKYDE